MKFSKRDAALVVIDPQNDFLSEKGTCWELVGTSVIKNGIIGNLERLFKSAKSNNYEVFISPHYFYPTDHGWKFNGPLEDIELQTRTFARSARSIWRVFQNQAQIGLIF